MRYRVEFAPAAYLQARQSHDWIAERSPERAARWYQQLLEKVGTLKTYPLRCPLASESDALGYEVRQLLVGKRQGVYRILFTVQGDVVQILAVRHSACGPLEP